jgi:AcrR family transcriptional regulator
VPRIRGAAAERVEARAALRAELLAAARGLAVENGGYDHVTIRLVADRVGYRAPIVYEYFANKHALLLELVRIGFTELADTLRAGTSLPGVALAYWDFAFAEPTLYRLMHGLVDVPSGTPEARECFRILKAAVPRDHPAATHDDDAPTDLVWSQLHGLVSLAMNDRLEGGPARGRKLLPFLAVPAHGTGR